MPSKEKEVRVALYTRVSTGKQTTENQTKALRDVAERRGWTVVAEYDDQGISGSKGKSGRPGLAALCEAAAKPSKPFDIVAAWSVDRLGRSLQDLVGFMADMRDAKVGLYLHQQQIDTTTPSGKAMYQMVGVFAEFERSMIVDRVNAGLDRARAKGVRLGRRPIPPIVLKKIDALLQVPADERLSTRAIADQVYYEDANGRKRKVSQPVVLKRVKALGIELGKSKQT
jgi:DNA invertase Pin-like site-specific DNA recombinase